MKIGLLADIHGNIDALQACLAAVEAAGVERLLVAGDFVGYYYAPSEVLVALDRFDWIAVRGNHEDMLAEWVAGRRHSDIGRRYGSGLATAAAALTAAQIEWLLELPTSRRLEIDGTRILLCHGTPDSTESYVYPDAPDSAFESFRAPGIGLAVYGHTHYPHQRELSGAGEPLRIVNPGSVGQPRNRVPGAHWALWDTSTGEIAARVEPYDPAPLQAECRRRDPQLPYLATVLTRT